MRISITGINFQYGDGFDKEYTGVSLNFISSGFKFNSTESVEISRDQYIAAKDDSDKLKLYIVNDILGEVNNFVNDLENYKSSLEV